MTRFNISLEEGVSMVLWAIEKSLGGEILVPRIPSYRITDVAKAIGPDCEYPIVGIRPGEKVHEEMITSSDSFTTVDLGSYFAILPRQTIAWKGIAKPWEPARWSRGSAITRAAMIAS
jgi:FlaA1/EpsC-like NDP-sugar epimerase